MKMAIKTFAKLLLVIGALAAAYKAYRKWKLNRAIRNLSGKVVLITGASSGIGEALARLLHSVGAKVILAGRNGQNLQQIKFTLDAATPLKDTIIRYSPAVLELDLTEGHALTDQAQAALKLFGHIDILINNAGISSRGSVLDTDSRVDRTVMETNFFGPVQLTKAILPSLLEQGSGHIVIISSLQGKIDAASKHALHGYFDSLRAELSHRNILVSIICLGYVNTRLSINALTANGSPHGITDGATSKGMTVEKAAYHSLQVIALQEREAVISRLSHWLALYMKLIWPAGLDWILRKRAKID